MTETEKWKARAEELVYVGDLSPTRLAAALSAAYAAGEKAARERTVKLLGNANDKKLITNGQYSYLWDVMHHG